MLMIGTTKVNDRGARQNQAIIHVMGMKTCNTHVGPSPEFSISSPSLANHGDPRNDESTNFHNNVVAEIVHGCSGRGGYEVEEQSKKVLSE